MNYYLVIGATNSVIDYADIYSHEDLAVKSAMSFVGNDSGPLSSGSIISSGADGVNRRALYLPLKVEETKLKSVIHVVVQSVPYLHSTTRAHAFYDEQEAKAEVQSFNAAVSRASFHAYLFSFSV